MMNVIGGLRDIPGPGQKAGSTIQVLGLGLPRCGTSSLHAALEGPVLGLGPCLHMKRILPSLEAQHLTLGIMREADAARRQRLIRALFDGYASAIDWPVHFVVADLMDLYPDAKLVLNLRPGPPEKRAASWARSVHGAFDWFATWTYRFVGFPMTTFRTHYHMGPLAYECLASPRLGLVPVGGGTCFDWATEEFYHRYLDHVREEAKKRGRELLEWEPSMGWAPLCEFLGKEPPAEGVEFPHLNDAQEMTRIKRLITVVGLCCWAMIGGSVYAGARFGPGLFGKAMEYWQK